MMCKPMVTLLFSAMLLPTSNLIAGNLMQRFDPQPAGNKFGPRETTLDIFGSYAVAENRDFSGGRLGIGVGANHFFNSYLGAGIDTGVDKFDWPNHINGSVILRYPIEKWSLAPYVFTGFGRQFHDISQWTYHIAGGLDYRLNQRTGVFTDIGATIPETSRDFMLWRMGVRFRF
jgi:hypothetical protein